MRVVHIVSAPAAGGAETYVKDLAIAAVKRGDQVAIAFVNRAEDVGRDRVFEQGYLEDLATAGIPYAFIGFRSRFLPILGAWVVRRLAKQWKPDVVHAHLFYGAIFAFFTDVPLVYTHHSTRLNGPRPLYRILNWRVRKFVAICAASATLISTFATREIVRINNAVAETRINPRQSFAGAGSQRVRIVAVGRLNEGKNLSFLLRAAALLRDVDYEIVFAGEGPDRSRLEGLAKELGIEARLTFLGNVVDVAPLLAGADVFAMSSKSEGLPISLLEATLTGLPVIVTDVGGCGDVVREIGHGFAVSVGDLQGYVDALRRLLESPTLRQTLSAKAIGASGLYRLDQAVELHMRMYDTLRKGT